MTLLRNIIHSGIIKTDSYSNKRGLAISNGISLILSGLVVLTFILRLLIVGRIPDIPLNVIGIVLFLLPILLNRFLWTTASRLFLCIIPIGLIWLANISQLRETVIDTSPNYETLRIYLLSMTFIPYLLFDKTKIWLLVVGILPTLLSFVFFEYFLTLAGVSSYQRGLDASENQLMQIRALISYLIVSAGCFAFQSIMAHDQVFNKAILSELKDKSNEIEAQNEELTQSQQNLSEMNFNLEDLVKKKTRNIELQNKQLTDYAHANAHHVRGPLARLLGLFQLLKMEKDLDHQWYFEKMEHEALEMDKITKRISRDLSEDETQSPKGI